ncbi:protein-glutamate methylesterase/protein-glutamine glutaminase [Anaerolinea thermophila]|uniref:Protein-glutamate methylesterase/protein-glutamine glutaminase n=1 Tax=Anaerolinea thermophila (strain DSM 14523 / JCM 11388 / NBRC 100420 / UNI-1) TaxID=926569 RepID=E8N2Z3_ANATU|nr:chemotaxis response regulator protein-glutamate methylesterase [Anaerolinea thermophila]BAJ65143.1 chemotaxis response regulator protein-glutamate methylesterase [Anaerolinea thermophila UNI-1]
MNTRPIRVLVVDDSAYIRKVVSEMLSRDPLIQVVGTARNGRDALEKVQALQPDVVTLDLIMPELDGIGFLKEQMRRRVLPIIVVSIASENGELVVQAMENGAVDFVQKPTALASERVYEIQEDLIAKVKTAANIEPARISTSISIPAAPIAAPAERAGKVDAVVLGISTGGPQALAQLIPALPGDLPVPMAVVLHMPPGYTALFAARLNEISRLEVLEAAEGDEMRPGRVLLAPAGQHLTLRRTPESRVVAALSLRPLDTPHRPSVDVLFKSAAEVYGSRLLGIVMTGMGNDGTSGAAWIKSQGGTVIAEARESCVVYGMPRSVVEAGLADFSVPLQGMAEAILKMI